MIQDTLNKLAKQRKDSSATEKTDTIIENGKRFGRKPYQLEGMKDELTMPEKAANDATVVRRKNERKG